MKVIMKRILKIAVGMIVALVLCFAASIVHHKYIERWPDEDLNEVMLDICRYTGGPLQDVTYFERKAISNDSDAEYYDIYVLNASRTWQTCRIENGVLFNFHSRNSYDLRSDEGEALDLAGATLSRLPNMLQPENKPSYLENNLVVTIVKIKDSPFRRYGASVMGSDNTIVWADRWWVQKWIGGADEVPDIVEAFCQRIMQPDVSFTDVRQSAFELLRQTDADYETLQQAYWMDFFNRMHRPQTIRAALALPDIRNYPAYLRAIPLITDAEIAATKDFPLVDLEKTRLNVHYAVKAPYIFLPIPPKRSPFPTLKNFTPGNKVKVDYRGECFLIETFVNGSLSCDSGKRKWK